MQCTVKKNYYMTTSEEKQARAHSYRIKNRISVNMPALDNDVYSTKCTEFKTIKHLESFKLIENKNIE